MKKLLFGLFATVLFYNFSAAQELKINSGKITSTISEIELPKEVKSELSYKTENSEFIIYQRYSEELKGNVTLVTDSSKRVVSLHIDAPVSQEVLRRWGSRCLKSIEDFMGCCLGV